MRVSLLFFFVFVFNFSGKGQGYFEKKKPHPYFISPELNYNAAINEFGLGARVERTVLKDFRAGIHANYFPGIRLTKELYVGVRASYWLLKSQRKYAFKKYTYDKSKPDLYVFGQLDYNRWLNKNISSFTPFVGLGSSYGESYLKYFLELKYNAAFNESWLSAGVTANMYGFKNRKKFIHK
jgi:hypothetical protein